MKINQLTTIAIFLLIYTQNLCQAIDSFEGEINFKVDFTDFKNDDTSLYKSGKFGSEMKMIWSKEGDQKRITRGSKIGGLEYALYLQKENIQYLKYKNVDTLYFFNCLEFNDSLINVRNKNGSIVHNENCHLYELKAKSKIQGKYRIEYYYSDKYKLDPNLFVNFKDGFASRIYKDTKSIFLKMKIIYQSYSIQYTAIEINEGEINRKEFELPNLPMVEI